MKNCSPVIRKNCFNYTQLHREGNKAIYEHSVTSSVKYYEVFRICTKPERILKGKTIQAGEVFPCNEDFGKTAWSCSTYEKALQRFNNLNA